MGFDDITGLNGTGDDQDEHTLFGPLARLAPPPFVLERALRGALAPPGDRPSEDEVREYLTTLADSYGLPRELVHAVAQTETGFDTDAVNANARSKGDGTVPSAEANRPAGGQRYGVMQVNEQHIGKTVPDADGTPFTIGDEIKTDWRANAKAGVALLAEQHDLAEMEQGPGSMPEDRAQQAYSGYAAGAGNRTRYLEQRADGLPADERDRSFLGNYQEAVLFGDSADPQGVNNAEGGGNSMAREKPERNDDIFDSQHGHEQRESASQRLPQTVSISYDPGVPRMTRDMEIYLRDILIAAGVTSANISATTNGEHAFGSWHPRGQAVDIDRVNGRPVREALSDSSFSGAIELIQHMANNESLGAAHENYGPQGLYRKGVQFRHTDLQSQHLNHIHLTIHDPRRP